MTRTTRLAQPSRRQLLLTAASMGAASLLAACGGGGSDGAPADPPGGAASASFASGPITGFGSIIVGGVRFDDSSARIEDDEGEDRSRDRARLLKLGVCVEIEGGRLDRLLGLGVAIRVVLGHSLLGPVNAVDTAAGTLTLLGQTVMVTTSTIFDESITGGLAGIPVGSIVEAHALYDPVTRRFVATRLELSPGATEYRLRGVISDLDTTAKTFKIGSETINYGSTPAPGLQALLANGAFVRVRLQTTPVAGAWVATRLRIGLRSLEIRNAEAEVEGTITAFTSLQSFEVNGLRVDASNATFPDGTADIVLGARVEASGQIVDGVLVATRVELKEPRLGKLEFELHGEIANLDTAAKTFALRGLTVWYGAAGVEYRNGSEATLANGRRVAVKGRLATDRLRIEARRIEFK
jgi:hypothetical protein